MCPPIIKAVLFSVILSSIVATGNGLGAILARSSFDAGYGAGPLAGQSSIPGSPGEIGFSSTFSYSPCTADAAAGKYLKVVPASGTYALTYTASTGGKIASDANAVTLTTSSGTAITSASRGLAAPITGRSIYVAAVIKAITAGTLANANLVFTLGTPSTTAPFFGIKNQHAAAGFGLASATAASSGTLVSGPNLIVAQFVWNGTSYSTAHVWLNPAGTPTASDANVANTGTAVSSIGTLGLLATNMSNNSEYAFDSIAIGTAWNDVVPVGTGAQIDPSGNGTISWDGPFFSTAFANYCAEPFTQVAKAMMPSPALGANILNFETSSGFAVARNQLNTNGTLNTSPALSQNDAITKIITNNGHTISVQLRSFDTARAILSGPISTGGAYLVKDNPTNANTMVSGSQGLMPISAINTPPAGVYLTFDQNISKFSAVINNGSAIYSPTVLFFDADGVMIGKYDGQPYGSDQNYAVNVGIDSPHAIIRSVWIGQGYSTSNLVIDDVAYVPGSAPVYTQTFSFASNAGVPWTWGGTSGWTTTSGPTQPAPLPLGYLQVQRPNSATYGDAKIYRDVTLNAGKYYLSGVGSGHISVSLGADWGSHPRASLVLNQNGSWRSDRCLVDIPVSGTYHLVIWPAISPGLSYLQSLTIASATETPYAYNTTAMQTARDSLSRGRGMQVIQDWNGPFGDAYFVRLKNWGCNVIRYCMQPDDFTVNNGTSRTVSVAASLEAAVADVESARKAGLKVVFEVSGGLFSAAECNVINVWEVNNTHAFWTHELLNERFCSLWSQIVTRLNPGYASTIWAYELHNEPYDADQLPEVPRQWWPVAVAATRTIRTIAPSAWIVYDVGPGFEFSGFSKLRPLPDNRVVYSAHFYYPAAFVMQGVYEATTGVNSFTATESYTSDPALLATFVAPADDFQDQWPVPIFIGEFSTSRWGPTPDTSILLQDMVNLFESRNYSWTYFSATGWHGWRLDYGSTYAPDFSEGSVLLDNPFAPLPRTDRGLIIYNALHSLNAP